MGRLQMENQTAVPGDVGRYLANTRLLLLVPEPKSPNQILNRC